MFPLNPNDLPFPLNNIYQHVNEDCEKQLTALLTLLFVCPPKMIYYEV